MCVLNKANKRSKCRITSQIRPFLRNQLQKTVGHRQGLTAAGYDADAEQLVDVVQTQKASLETLNKNLNTAVQERDLAVSNANDLYLAMTKARDEQVQAESVGTIYREVLRQRGGLALAVQNLSIKPLPENAFEYQIDLVQVSPGKSRASGSIELRLIKGTEILVVPLEDKNFNFENYERLTGRWSMPKGFKPDSENRSKCKLSVKYKSYAKQ